MSIKIYSKVGKKSYKEAKLLKKLEEVIEKKLKEDPNFTFKVAHSPDELKYLHDQYCIEEAEIISETKNDDEVVNKTKEVKEYDDSDLMNDNDDTKTTVKDDNMATKGDYTNTQEFAFENPDFETPDPFTSANPKVRDYVLKDSMSPDGNKHEIGSTKTLDEPTSHGDAFAFPDDYEDGKKTNSNNKGPSNSEPKEKQAPVNPAFDEMSHQKKSKQTKRFAKHIVEAVAMGLEFGYVWWTTKDINEAALAGYELNNEMDLTLLLSLNEGQEITVREFFVQKCAEAKEAGKISVEDKEDLADALADVMMEKGIAPTPMQTLIMVSLKIVGGQVMKAVMSKGETSSVLMQLRTMNAEVANQGPQMRETPQPMREQKSQQSQQAYQEPQHTQPSGHVDEEAEQIMRQIESAEEEHNNTNMSPVNISTDDAD